MDFKFKINIAKPKKETVEKSKIVSAYVIDRNGLKACIDQDNNGEKPPKILEFTDSSYDLYGKTTIFRKYKDKDKDKYIRIERSEKCKFFPGLRNQYIPFAPNWDIKGYIIKTKSGVELFEFKRLIGINGYEIDKTL